MTTLALAAMLQLSVAATAGQSYDDAYRKCETTGQPMVVVIGADWCPACQTLKNSVLPQVERNGGLKNCAVTYLNTDQDPKLTSKLMRGGSIPQLIVFRKTEKGWKRRHVIGARSPNEIQSLIQAGCAEATATTTKPAHKLSSFKDKK